MAYIGRQLARGENKLFDDISSSFNGSTTTFNLTVSSVATATATPYQLFVSLGGVMQKPNTDFTTAGNQITFTTAPAAGLSCWIMMQGDTIDQAAIPDSSVTPSKISGSNFAFSGDLRLKDADGSNYVGFKSPTTVASNVVWTLPAADSSGSKFLKSNGSGVLSWDTPATIGGATGVDFNDNVKARWGTDNDLEIFCNNANSIINDAGVGDLLLQVGGSTKATVSSTGLGVTGALTVSTNAVITGNLTVSGTTTTVDSVTLSVKDKNIEMGAVSSPSDTTADGGGLTLKGGSDKTFNWVNATDAWTSSEHIHLLDGKKLFVGGASGTTDGIEIHHTSNNSFINDSGTGSLQLQLGGSTKLEITSGGIDVTGAITVGGNPLSSAPTVDLVADGAIAANKPVAAQSNGKIKEIKETITIHSNPVAVPTSVTSPTQAEGWEANFNSSLYIADKNVIVRSHSRDGNSDKGYVRLGTPNSDGTVTWNSNSTLNNENPSAYWICSAWDTVNQKLMIFYKNGSGANSGSGNVVADCFNISGTPAGLTSLNVAASIRTANQYHEDFSVVYDSVHEVFWLQVRLAWSSSAYAGYFLRVTPNYSNYSHTISTSNGQYNVGESNGIHHPDFAINTDCDELVSIYKSRDDNKPYVTVKSINSDGSTQNAVKSAALDGTNTIDGWCAITYDPDNDLYVARWTQLSGTAYARTITVSGTGSGISFTYGAIISLGYGTYANMTYDTTINRVVTGYGNGSGHPYIRYLAVSGTSLTAGNELQLWNNSTQVADDRNLNNITFDSTNGQTYYSFSDSSETVFKTIKGGTSTTTLSSGYIGFSSAAINDTATGTIAVSGNTNSSLSGLTAGSKQYVQKDGTLATTADSTLTVEAGVALSSSKLLIG